MTFDQIPQADSDAIKRRLVQQIQAMDTSELQIVAKSKESLSLYVSEAFRAMASLMGYIIAVPIAWAMRVAESMFAGFADGWDAAFRHAGY